ncbi:MAG: ABC transporter substrate-binding protein [bacterium]|nr:ABC transporter substrate-binding protein [bacterium]
MKKYLVCILLICLSLIISVISCGPKEDEPVEIEFWHSMQGPLLVSLQNIVRNFEQENPNIKVNLKYQGSYTQLLQKLEAQVAVGEPPNISQAFGAWTDKFINDGLLIQLDGELQGAEKNFYEIFYRNNLFEGKIYSIPFNKSVPILYYNKDHFTAAGLDTEKAPETWKEFKEYCVKLNSALNTDPAKEKIYPLSFSPSIWFITSHYIQNGGTFFNKNTNSILPDREILKDSINFFADLNKNQLMELTKERSYQDKFKQGNTTFIFASCVSYIFLKDEVKFNLGFAPLPHGKSKGSILSGTNLVVFKNASKNKVKASVKLINYLLKDDNIARWTIDTYYLPVRNTVVNSPQFKTHLQEKPALSLIYDEIDYLQEEPKEEVWVNGRKLLRTTIEKIFFLNTPIDEALDEFYNENK